MEVVVAGRWSRQSSNYPETKRLYSVMGQVNRGQARFGELETAQEAVTELLINQLDSLGVDIVSDGGIRWDSIFDVTRQMIGCSGFTNLVRIPETNQFHRQPVVQLPLMHKWSILLNDLHFVQSLTEKEVVVSLPGPFSTALQTANLVDYGKEKLGLAYAGVLRQEASILQQAGAAMVRFVDPQVLDHPEDASLIAEMEASLVEGLDQSKTALATYFKDITQFPDYFKLPFGVFFVDFVDGPKSVEALADFPKEARLVAGVVDARQSFNRSRENVQALMNKIRRYVPRERMLLSTNTDLQHLPWETNLEKAAWLKGLADG